MGINLFVEGNPVPIVVRVRLSRDVTSFSEIKEVVSSLELVEREMRRVWPEYWPRFALRRRREVCLLRFQVASPPFFEVLTDPAWLAIFIAIILGYKTGKESIAEISSDLNNLFDSIKGLSGRQAELLSIAVRMSIDKSLDLGEKASIQAAKRFRNARQRLLGKEKQLPDIEVIDVINRDKAW